MGKMNDILYPHYNIIEDFQKRYSKSGAEASDNALLTRAEFIRTIEMIEELLREECTFNADDSRVNKNGCRYRVYMDWHKSDNDRARLTKFYYTITKYAEATEELLNSTYYLTVTDVARILDFEETYVSRYLTKVGEVDYIYLRGPIRHLIDKKFPNPYNLNNPGVGKLSTTKGSYADFYRQKIFFSRKSLEQWVKERFKVIEDNITVKVYGEEAMYISSLNTKAGAANSLVQSFADEEFIKSYVDEDGNKYRDKPLFEELSDEEVSYILNVLEKDELSDTEGVEFKGRHRHRYITIEEFNSHMSNLQTKISIKNEIRNDKYYVRDTRYANAYNTQVDNKLLTYSHKKIAFTQKIGDTRNFKMYFLPSKIKDISVIYDEKIKQYSYKDCDCGNYITISIPKLHCNLYNINRIMKKVLMTYAYKIKPR